MPATNRRSTDRKAASSKETPASAGPQPKCFIVMKPWKAKTGEPLILKAGDIVRIVRVEVGKNDWYWCEKGDIQGWVPAEYLKIFEEVMGKVLVDYSSRELEAEVGIEIVAGRRIMGWVWGTNTRTKEEGWIEMGVLGPRFG
jgi:hypothetical protein